MTFNLANLRNSPAQPQDIEAQQTAPCTFKMQLTQAKAATMALAGTAGLLASAYLASADPFPESFAPGRQLTNLDCSADQQRELGRLNGLFRTFGIVMGAGVGGMLAGQCLRQAAGEGDGWAAFPALAGHGMVWLSFADLLGGAVGTTVTGIMYANEKRKC